MATKPTASQIEHFSDTTDVLQYSCRAPFIPQDRELRGVFVVRQDVSCAVQVNSLYYSCRKFEEIFCWCGDLGPEARINDKIRANCKVVNHVCHEFAAGEERPVPS